MVSDIYIHIYNFSALCISSKEVVIQTTSVDHVDLVMWA